MIRTAALILILIALFGFTAGNTFSYFSDVEVGGGKFKAGVWDQASNCIVDISKAKLTENLNKLHDIFIENIGKSNIIITKFVLQWDCGGNLTILKIGNHSFVVNQATPAIVSNHIRIEQNKIYPVNIWFEGLIFENNTFTILLFFEDGSRKDVRFVPSIGE
jgi:predicted ribosomally synthesized peptide with SipW-like signal peptide